MAIELTGYLNHSNGMAYTLPDATNRFVLLMSFIQPASVKLVDLDMTLLASDPLGNRPAYIWGLAIPDSVPAGYYVVSAVWENTRTFGAAFTGVSNSDPVVHTAATATAGQSTSSSLTLNTVEGGWVHDFLNNAATKTAGAGQTVLYSIPEVPTHSYKSGLTEGTTNMSWTWTPTTWYGHVAVSLRPAGGRVIAVMY